MRVLPLATISLAALVFVGCEDPLTSPEVGQTPAQLTATTTRDPGDAARRPPDLTPTASATARAVEANPLPTLSPLPTASEKDANAVSSPRAEMHSSNTDYAKQVRQAFGLVCEMKWVFVSARPGCGAILR